MWLEFSFPLLTGTIYCYFTRFSLSDGGRSMWENAWRKCRERILGQTVHPASVETPSQSRLGIIL